MITKQLISAADVIASDSIDTEPNSIDSTSDTTNITADEAINTHAILYYEYPKHSLLVHEDVIDYETQLALHEKWKNLTITDNFLFEKVMRNKRICVKEVDYQYRKLGLSKSISYTDSLLPSLSGWRKESDVHISQECHSQDLSSEIYGHRL